MAVTSTHQQYSMGHSLWEVMLRFASDFISVMITAWRTKNHLKLFFHLLILMLMSTSIWALSPSGTMTVSVVFAFIFTFVWLFVVSDALFNVENATYYVEENDGPVYPCVVLADGCLERDVVVDYATFDAKALSTLQNLPLWCMLFFKLVMWLRGSNMQPSANHCCAHC